MNCVIETDALEEFESCLSAVASEAKLRVSEDGIQSGAVDPANVAMVEAELVENGFIEAPDFEATLGINLERFRDTLRLCGDTVTLEYRAETRKLHVASGNFSANLALIDPDAIRQEPDLPDLEDMIAADLQLEKAKYLKEAVKAADLVSDHMAFEADPGVGIDDSPLVAVADGDTDDMTYRFDGDMIASGDVDAEAAGLYSLDYMKELTRPLASDMATRFKLPDEAPLEFGGVLSVDGDTVGTVTYLLAPRIQS